MCLLVCVQEGSLECYLVELGLPPDDVDRVVTQVNGAAKLRAVGLICYLADWLAI